MEKFGFFNFCLNVLSSLSVEEMFYFTSPGERVATKGRADYCPVDACDDNRSDLLLLHPLQYHGGRECEQDAYCSRCWSRVVLPFYLGWGIRKSGTSSLGCAICDPVIAVWCFAGAPSLHDIIRGKTRHGIPRN
jgi:hypothetical protein